MDVREKLVELIRDGRYKAEAICNENNDCQTCTISDPVGHCKYGCIADHLIANGVTVQEWISVTDSQKPKDRKRYFIAYVYGDSDMHFFGEAMYHAFEGNGLVERPHFSDEGVEGMRVTHWMEIPKLPQPPKGE